MAISKANFPPEENSQVITFELLFVGLVRDITQRKEAAKLAQKALNFGNKNPNLNAIIVEFEMPLWRYKLRRIARMI